MYHCPSVSSYELSPSVDQNQKSFYRKAHIERFEDGSEALCSYDTMVAYVDKNGEIVRTWDDWSVTSGKHIKAFLHVNKKDYFRLPYKRHCGFKNNIPVFRDPEQE